MSDDATSTMDHTPTETEKADVKARVKEAVAETLPADAAAAAQTATETVTAAAGHVATTARSNPVPAAAAATGLLGFAIGYLLAHRR